VLTNTKKYRNCVSSYNWSLAIPLGSCIPNERNNKTNAAVLYKKSERFKKTQSQMVITKSSFTLCALLLHYMTKYGSARNFVRERNQSFHLKCVEKNTEQTQKRNSSFTSQICMQEREGCMIAMAYLIFEHLCHPEDGYKYDYSLQ